MMKLSCRPLTLNSYKAFKKQKQVWENSLLYFLQNFWKKKKKKLLYSIIWPLTSNFHHTVKTILILPPAKFHFNHNWGKFYNMLFFSFKKGLNGQNWLDTFLGTEKTQPQTCSKNSWRSIWPVWTDICKNGCTHDALMHLYINQSTKQVIFFSKNQPVIRNWMRGQIYVLVNSIPVLIIYVTRNFQTNSAWILTLTDLAN